MSDMPALLIDASDLVNEHRGEGWLYKSKFVPADSQSLFLDRQTPAYVDTNEISATAVISTATPDRVQDILIPRGCITDSYAKNPVVLWSHGLDEGLKLPIGMSEHPDGRLALEITDDEVKAKCYFAPTQIGMQIFDLVARKFVRACSVRETPVPGQSRQKFLNGQTCTVVLQWLLEEWSWCLIGVNPDALAKCLSLNRLDGQPIAEPIFKSLTAMLPEKKPQVPGFGDLKMADEETKDPKKTPADEVQTTSGGDQTDGGTMVSPEPEADDPEQHPFGKQLIDATHAGIKSRCKALTHALGDEKTSLMENKELRPELSDVNDMMKSMCKSLEGMHAKHYPHFKCMLKSDDMDEPEEGGGEGEEASEGDMKSFLASSSVATNQLIGIEHQISRVLKSAKLSTSEKKSLESCISNLEFMRRKAKSYRPNPMPSQATSGTTVSADEQAKIDAAYAKLKSAS